MFNIWGKNMWNLFSQWKIDGYDCKGNQQMLGQKDFVISHGPDCMNLLLLTDKSVLTGFTQNTDNISKDNLHNCVHRSSLTNESPIDQRSKTSLEEIDIRN